jgi:hypothetical protein
MSAERRQERETDRWRNLPPRTPLEDLVTGQEVPPKAQVLEGPGISKLDEATRYPA